jgi:hypothetical protein
VHGNTALEAIEKEKKAVVNAETTNNVLCLLSLGVKVAFDNVSHSYLYTMLKAFGFSEGFHQRFKSINEFATSFLRINGRVTNPIPLRCSIRQGCPLSTQLFVLFESPNIHTGREVN